MTRYSRERKEADLKKELRIEKKQGAGLAIKPLMESVILENMSLAVVGLHHYE